MGFSQSAAMHFLPLLARIVLGAAFVTAGWNKLFTEADFSGPRAQTLIDLGVVAAPAPSASTASVADWWPRNILVAYQTGSLRDKAAGEATPQPTAPQSADPPAESPPANEPHPAPPLQPVGVEPVPSADPSAGAPAETATTAPAELTVRARRLHSVTILAADKAPWTFPSPVVQAWAIALLELVGGGLLLIGLFSRIWAFGLAVSMAILVSLTSIERIADTLIFTMAPAEYNQLFCRLGLLTLALGVFMTGPGALSLDRAIFRSRVVTIEPPTPKPLA